MYGDILSDDAAELSGGLGGSVNAGDRHGRNALTEAADVLQKAIDKALDDPANRTPDLGGKVTTARMGEAVAGVIAGK